jgi:hypothetical protein
MRGQRKTGYGPPKIETQSTVADYTSSLDSVPVDRGLLSTICRIRQS